MPLLLSPPLWYLSPEELNGNLPSTATDIFCWCLVLLAPEVRGPSDMRPLVEALVEEGEDGTDRSQADTGLACRMYTSPIL